MRHETMPVPARNRDVLVVVPCLDEEAHLPGLLVRVLDEAGEALVVVADGGSRDRSRAIVTDLARSHANLVLLDNPRRIQSAAVNLAARRFGAGRRWLVRIDAHADYPGDFIARLQHAAEAMEATSVVVPMVSRGEACFQRAAAAAQNSVLGTGGSPHRHLGKGQWVEHGHHALFDLSLFMAVGGYDESFACNEDAELDRRLLAAGGRIWLEPQAAITYYPRATGRALLRQYYRYGDGRARNLRRHPARVRLRQMLPLGVVPAVLAALCGVALSGFAPVALLLAVPAFMWLATSLLAGLVIGVRARCACAAASGIAAAVMHAGWSLGFIAQTLRGAAMPPPPGPLMFEPGDDAVIAAQSAPSAARGAPPAAVPVRAP